MILIFGIRHTTTDYYTPADFGFVDPSWNGVKFVSLARYFHLMYIPFFPVGKKWAIEQPDGKQYELSASVLAQVNSYGLKQRTPWYTFIGLMLVGLVFIISSVTSMMHTSRYDDYTPDTLESYADTTTENSPVSSKWEQEVNEKIDHPSLNDFYEIEIDTVPQKHDDDNTITTAFKVHEFNDSVIVFELPGKKMTDPFAYEYKSEIYALFDGNNKPKLLSISKSKLKDLMIPVEKRKSAEVSSEFGGVEIMGIDRQEEPDLQVSLDTATNTVIRLIVFNNGLRASGLKLKSVTGDMQWTKSGSNSLAPDESITLSGKGEARAFKKIELSYQSPDGTAHTLVISGAGKNMKTKLD